MIVLDLACESDHRFEGWFSSATSFAKQLEQGLVSCPVCASSKVTKRLSAPHVHTPRQIAAKKPVEPQPGLQADDVSVMLRAVHHWVKNNCEDVGARFPDEARKIHYGDVEARGIRGEASAEERRALRDEGITTLSVPVVPDAEELN